MSKGLHITPAMCDAAYDLLKTTPPFRRWKLPSVEKLSWLITSSAQDDGVCYNLGGGSFKIDISTRRIGTVDRLVRVIAHEMVHIRCDLLKIRADHGRDFKRLATLVCKHHGFELKSF